MMATKEIRFDRLLANTGRAYLFEINRREFWVPVKLCRHLRITGKRLLNGTTTHGTVQIPDFKYEEIAKVTEVEAWDTITIERHTPEKIEANESNIISELKR
jgi:hypothetical protein